MCLFFKVYLFILKERAQGLEGQREREEENLKQAPCLAWSPMQGSKRGLIA